MTDTIRIPIGGTYIEQNGMRWHISISGGTISLRLVDFGVLGTPSLAVSMPASNVVKVFPIVADGKESE